MILKDWKNLNINTYVVKVLQLNTELKIKKMFIPLSLAQSNSAVGVIIPTVIQYRLGNVGPVFHLSFFSAYANHGMSPVRKKFN